jgi:VanZ family protein
MRKQTSHWKKTDHIAFALMLPFLVMEFSEHNIVNWAAIAILWVIALLYDLYEHYKEEKQ